MELVTTPDKGRNLVCQLEDPTCRLCVPTYRLRAVDGVAGIGQNSLAPASDLVAKCSKSGEAAAEYSALSNYTP
jgi:hypothetical protein